jgi:ribosomal protein L37E
VIDAKLLPAWLQRIVLKRRMDANHGRLYIVEKIDRDHITCLICGNTSYNPGDVVHKFCVLCGYFVDAERDLYVSKKNRYTG